jgi:hypothetical protein
MNLDRDCLMKARERRSSWYAGHPIEYMLYNFNVIPPSGRLPAYTQREMIEDFDKLIELQVAGINWHTESYPDCDWLPYLSTANLGQGIIPTMFGAEQVVVENNSPFTEGRVLQSITDVEKLPERIDPEHDGWGPRLKELSIKLHDLGGDFVPVCCCDHQSPYGIAAKLLGNEELILAMYDAPELVDRLLSICTQATIDTARAMQKWIGKENVALNVNHPIPGEGGIILYDDYISVITPELHTRFCQPQNERLFQEFGRGHLHTCGPYFEGYINAVLACRPISIDTTYINGFNRTKEDMLRLRRITREHGIRHYGTATTSVENLALGKFEQPDEAYVRELADGGFFWGESGSREMLDTYAAWAKSIPN